jgi:hypothetical protein
LHHELVRAEDGNGVQPHQGRGAELKRFDWNGKTVCITVGEKLLVFLVAPAATLGWAPIRVAPPGVLSVAPFTLMLTRNVTAETFSLFGRAL